MVDRDPGWKLSPLLFVPILGPRLHARRLARSGADGIVRTRQLFASFVTAVVLFAVVLVGGAVPDPEGSADITPWILGVCVVGVAALVATRQIAGRSLDCSTAPALAESYRTRFFLGIAVSESVALLGFVGAFLAPGGIVYLVGGAIALVGFSIVAPTRRHLEREDEELRGRGCAISLYDALA